jgi:hypothetical protein
LYYRARFLVLVVTDGTGEAIDVGVLAPLALGPLGLPVPAMVVSSVDVVLKSRTARLFNALREADHVLYYYYSTAKFACI